MSNRRKEKGDRQERAIVDALNSVPGVMAEKVPLSGSTGGSFGGDIHIDVAGFRLVAEVKARKNGAGFKVIKRWLGEQDMLFLKEDRQPALVVMSLATLESMLGRIGEDAIDGDEEYVGLGAAGDAGDDWEPFPRPGPGPGYGEEE